MAQDVFDIRLERPLTARGMGARDWEFPKGNGGGEVTALPPPPTITPTPRVPTTAPTLNDAAVVGGMSGGVVLVAAVAVSAVA